MIFIFENDVNAPSKSNNQKNLDKNVAVLNVTDENSMIRIRIH